MCPWLQHTSIILRPIPVHSGRTPWRFLSLSLSNKQHRGLASYTTQTWNFLLLIFSFEIDIKACKELTLKRFFSKIASECETFIVQEWNQFNETLQSSRSERFIRVAQAQAQTNTKTMDNDRTEESMDSFGVKHTEKIWINLSWFKQCDWLAQSNKPITLLKSTWVDSSFHGVFDPFDMYPSRCTYRKFLIKIWSRNVQSARDFQAS